MVFFALTGAVIVNGATVIWKDTNRGGRVQAPFATCSEGIHDLYRGFQHSLAPVDVRSSSLAPRRPTHDGPARADAAMLDELMISLRPVCQREGAEAQSAYEALTLWRYQYEDLTRVAEHMFVPNAERALQYQSPGAVSPRGNEP